MKPFRPLYRATVNYWLIVSILAIIVLLSWKYFNRGRGTSSITIEIIESDTCLTETSDTLHINYANATTLSRFGFKSGVIVNMLKYRDAGGTIRDIQHLLNIRGIDSTLVTEKGHLISFDRPMIKYDYYTPKTKIVRKRLVFARKISLYYTPEDTLIALGINRNIIDSILAYRERYILRGSMPIDSILGLTSEAFAQAMSGHIGERKKYNIETKKETRKIYVNINTATSDELCTVIGIGEKSAKRIIERRVKLGGFVDIRQLAEIATIDSIRYAQIAPQLFAQPQDITKLNINEATKDEVLSHPYMRRELGRQLLRLRYRHKKLTREMVEAELSDTLHDRWLLEYLEF
ncbi:MAG: helix-hairpin-helix domain-containing protein [Bacteroidia bacterium]|nr:helix-hairpin-helix domain-containing protein [Bacteroidia bacterium]